MGDCKLGLPSTLASTDEQTHSSQRAGLLSACRPGMLSLLHGAVGYLDELLAFGIVVTIGVIIYFVFAVVESRSDSKKDTN